MALSKPLQRFLEDNEGQRWYAAPSQPITRASILANTGQKASSPDNDQGGTSPVSSQDSVGSSDCQSGSTLLRKSSQSSATVATSVETGGTAEWVDEHVLSCIFRKEASCPVLFHRDNVNDWYSHSISHYNSYNAVPPTHALCVYCDESFDSNSPLVCWRDRMSHIAEHILGAAATKKRPDFGVAKDMLKKGCISQDHYNEYSKDSERPTIEGLRAHDYVPADKKAKIDAAQRAYNRVVVPLSRREMRESRVARSQRGRHQ
jgi:hypothetical protein